MFIFHPAYSPVIEYPQVAQPHSWLKSAQREPVGYVVEFPAGEKFPLCLSVHQRALRLEIAPNLSFISWLRLFRPEGIDMQTWWFSCRSADQAFIQKAMAPLLIHFSFTHTMTLLSMVHVNVWLQWGCIGSKHTWIRPNPDIGWMDGRMSPLQIFTPLWKRLVTLILEVKCPHSCGRG